MKVRWKNVIIAAAVIVFAAALFFTVYSQLTKKSITDIYIDAESKKFNETAGNIESYYTDFINKQKPYLESANSSRTEFTVDIDGGAESFGLDETISEILGKTKLIVETKRQPERDISVTEANLLLERAPFINAQLFSDRDTIWAAIPDLMPDRYFSVQRDKLDGFYDRFSIPVKPLKIISGSEIASNISFGAEAFRESARKLGDIYAGYLTDETVIDNGSVTVQIDGQPIEGREILILLDEEKATVLLEELLTAISDDDVLLQYTYGNFANISELLDDAGIFRLLGFMDETGAMTLSDYEREILNRLNVTRDIEGFKDRLKIKAASYRLKDGLKMKVVLDKNGDIFYRETHLDFLDAAGSGSFAADIVTGSGSSSPDGPNHRLASVTVAQYGAGGADAVGRITELSVASSIKKPKGSQAEGNLDIIYAVTPDGGVRSETNMVIDFSGRTDDKTMKRTNSVKLRAGITGDTGEGSINADIESSSWENRKLNKSNSSMEIKLAADLPFLGIENFSAAIGIADEGTFAIEDFSLPEFDQEVVTDLYTASDAEINKLEMEIMASFGAFYLNNRYIFDALLGWG